MRLFVPRNNECRIIKKKKEKRKKQQPRDGTDHFFPRREAFSLPPRLRPYHKAPPLTQEEVASALSKCSSSLAPGPDGIPYSTCTWVNRINPSIPLQILSRLVCLLDHPASLKRSTGVVLDKPGKPSYEYPFSCQIIVLICTL